MATYRQIQGWVREHYGFTPRTGWIAHCKALNGLPVRRAQNKKGATRREPCPPDKQAAIERALWHFGLLRVKRS
jgi:hypothetical protein